MMRILVTGGAGFIGSHVAEAYLEMGHQVTVLDNLSGGRRENIPQGAQFAQIDIRDAERVEALFKENKFNLVNNHAAQMSVPDSVKDPRFDASVNVMGLLNLLESSRKYGASKFIHISSGGTVYGSPRLLPATEKYPIAPESPYGITKAVAENYLAFYRRQYGLDYTSLRYSNVYGPRQLPHGEAGVVAIFIKAIMEGRTPVIFGDGKILRDYVFVKDVARANAAALAKGSASCINIGTGKPTSVKELYDLVAKALGHDGLPDFGPDRPGDLKANYLSNLLAKRRFGWKPKVSLEAGLQETVAFFKNRVPAGALS